MPRPSIAIVGAGFSGTTLATQILASAQRNAPKVLLIDRSGRFGPGLAYSTSHPAHLMNVRTGRLSVVPHAPNDFTSWIAARHHGRADAAQFAQRAAYGAYLEATVRGATHASEPGTLNLVRDAAIGVRASASGVEINLQSGGSLNVDAAVLALGNQPAATPAPFDHSADMHARVLDAWDPRVAQIAPEDDVLLLGSGLTMVDAMLRLAATPRQGKVFALSRHGLVARPHSDHHADSAPLWLEGEVSALLADFRREIEATVARGAPWQDVFDRLRPQTVAVWTALTSVQQARFLRHLRPYWDAHRHRMAPHLHTWLEAMRGAGSLEVLAGRIVAATHEDARFKVTYQPRGATARRDLGVAHVINCTGASADLSKSQDPLIQHLLKTTTAHAHSTGLGLSVEPNGRVIGATGRAHARLFALGPIVQGAFWETTAVPEIRANAAAMAKALIALTNTTATGAIADDDAHPPRQRRRGHIGAGPTTILNTGGRA